MTVSSALPMLFVFFKLLELCTTENQVQSATRPTPGSPSPFISHSGAVDCALLPTQEELSTEDV